MLHAGSCVDECVFSSFYSNVRLVNGSRVQSGDGRPDGDVKWATGTQGAQSSVTTSDPASYLKAASLW